MNSDTTEARSWRSDPEQSSPPPSPPTRTAVPLGVSARRSRVSDALPAMSMISVVAPRAVGEVVHGVVEHADRAERAHQVGLALRCTRRSPRRRAASASWTAKLPTPPDAPVTRTCWPASTPADVGDGLEGGERRRPGSTAACSKVRLAGLRGQLVLAGHGVLGEGALADAVDLVAGREPRHRRADRVDGAGQVETDAPVAAATQADGQADSVRRAGHQVPGAAVEPGGVHADQHLAVAADPRDARRSADRRTSAPP